MDSRIIEVVVFPDRARVTRRATLAVEAGTQTIELGDLPLVLRPESIRATGRGSAAATLLGVDVRRTYFTQTPAAAVHALESQIEQVTAQDQALLDQGAALAAQLNFITGLADKSAEQLARGLALGRAELSQGEALMTFVQQQADKVSAGQREINRQRQELSRVLAKLKQELQQQQSAAPRERYAAYIEINVQRAGELTLDVTYLVTQASWRALYDLRLSESDAALQLAYLGQVSQQTGEDWSDVALTLSTARPSLTAVTPELKPWYINEVPLPAFQARQPARLMAMAAAPAPQSFPEAEQPDAVGAGALPPMEMALADAVVSEQGSSVTFTLTQRATIPADGTPHKVNITTLDLSPKLDYLAAPKLADAVYRRARVVNRSAYLLLAGDASLFVDGDFVGTLALKRAAPNEEFELTLGVDERFALKRELKLRDVDKKIIGDKRRLRVAYEIEIKNLRDGAAEVEVRDQFPISQHEAIKARLEAADPKPIEQTDLNELRWRLTLPGNSQHVLRFEFTVEHPAAMRVIGLP